MNTLSTLLFAAPSFAEGMSRVLDIRGTLNVYNESLTENQADFWALYADWRATGQDIRDAEAEVYCEVLRQGEINAGSSGRTARTSAIKRK